MFLQLCTCYTLPLIYYRIQSCLDNQVYRAATSMVFKYGGQHDNRVTLSLVLKNQFMRITYIRKNYNFDTESKQCQRNVQNNVTQYVVI